VGNELDILILGGIDGLPTPSYFADFTWLKRPNSMS